jgi:hypothetical protein
MKNIEDVKWSDIIDIVPSDIVPKGTMIMIPKPRLLWINHRDGVELVFEPINPKDCVVIKNIGDLDDNENNR